MSSSPTISFSGLASGIDTTGVITQLTTTAQKPIALLQGKEAGFTSQLADWQSFNTQLSSLQTAANALNQPSTYTAASASSSNTAVASITTLPGATFGSHALTVTQLAQAQKVVSSSVSSSSTALGKTGSFTLNGKTIQINSSDALADISVKINAAKTGVSATVVNVGPNDFRITLTSNQTGAINSIAAADSSGTVLSDLGILNTGTAALRQGVNYTQGSKTYTGATSLTLASATQSIGSLLGITAGSAPSGTFHISNGGTGAGNAADISVNLNTNSLTDVANAINSAGVSGVSAEVITVPDANGNLNRIHQLRIVSSNVTPATASTATSTGQAVTAGDVFGGSFTVNGQAVSLTGNTNTLSQLQTAIQATTGNAGITATISAGNKLVLSDASGNPISATLTSLHDFTGTADNGPLSAPTIANGTLAAAVPPAFTDPNGILSTVGVLQNSFKQTVTQAQDSKFNLDGLDLTRSTNAISDVVTGATINLLGGTAASPGTSTLSISQNTGAVIQSVNTFANAYNAIQDFITKENKFTPPASTTTGASGTNPPLFGNTTLSQVQEQLAQTLTAVSGTTTLQSIGVTLDQTGHLNVDSNVLTSALQADPNSVSNLFGLSGNSDSSNIQFIKGGPKSAASTGAGYAVKITQPATQANGQAAVAGTVGAVSTAPETLTFGGSLFSAGVKLTLPVGSTLQDTVNLINATSSLNTSIYATVDSSNHLILASQSYGTGTNFTVSSDKPAAVTNSGIGSSLAITPGQDVHGTINGEPATGDGRTLYGNAGDAHAEGIQLLVTATSPSPVSGATGHVTVTHGVGDSLSAALTQILDPINGSVAGAESNITSQLADAQDQITKIQTEVSTYKDYLTQLFSQMETRVSALQSQGSAFAASVNGAAGTNSSSSSSSSTSG
jgi:flagellar hook-associated protein 2